MKVKIRREGEERALLLPAGAAQGLGEEAELVVLREGVLLLARPGLLQEISDAPVSELEGREVGKMVARRPSLSAAEAALVRKLCAIRYQERLVPPTLRKLGANERAVLEGLVGRGIVKVFKSQKYKDGVYDIPREWYNGAADEKAPGAAGPAKSQSAPAVSPKAPGDGRNVPINSVAHLQRFGYMVLDSENEAKSLMEGVQAVQKTDAVKGVRGFDRRYYVLRRSFLAQHKEQIMQGLEKGPAHADDLAQALGLSPTAASVLLMILADEGDVIEKRRGMWERA